MRILTLLCLSTLFLSISEGGVAVLYSPFLAHLGYAISALGMLISLDGVGRLAVRLPSGLSYTKARARLLSVISLLILFLSTVLFPAADSALSLGFLILLHAAGYGMATTFMMAMLIDLMKALGTKTGSVMGWFTSALSLGHALGGMLSAYLADLYGYPTAFFTIAALPLLTICFLLPLTVSHRSPSLQEAKTDKKAPQPRWTARLAEFRHLGPVVLWAALLAFYLNFLTDVLSTLFPLFALGLGISLSSIGFLKGINSIFGTATRLFSGMIFVWMDYRKVNGIALVLIAVAVMAVPSAAKIPAFVVIFSLFGICRALLRVSSSAIVVDEMKESTNGSGLASGIYHAGLDLGVLTAPVTSGFFAEAFGIPAAFRFLPILLLGIMGSLLFIPRRTRLAVPE